MGVLGLPAVRGTRVSIHPAPSARDPDAMGPSHWPDPRRGNPLAASRAPASCPKFLVGSKASTRNLAWIACSNKPGMCSLFPSPRSQATSGLLNPRPNPFHNPNLHFHHSQLFPLLGTLQRRHVCAAPAPCSPLLPPCSLPPAAPSSSHSWCLGDNRGAEPSSEPSPGRVWRRRGQRRDTQQRGDALAGTSQSQLHFLCGRSQLSGERDTCTEGEGGRGRGKGKAVSPRQALL